MQWFMEVIYESKNDKTSKSFDAVDRPREKRDLNTDST